MNVQMAPAGQHPTAHHDGPNIQWYLTRNNGTLVPMVAADELPSAVRLLGVPRALGVHQVYGLQNIGSAPFTGLVFKLEPDFNFAGANDQQAANHNASGIVVVDPLQQQHLSPDSVHRHSLAPLQQQRLPIRQPTNWRPNSPANPETAQSIIDAILATPASNIPSLANKTHTAPAPSGKEPDPEKKEYCTYWMRHGECDYEQQGCLYKHEMPTNPAKLAALGFRSLPRWWVEKKSAVKMGTMGSIVGERMTPEQWMKTEARAAGGEKSESEDGEMKDVQHAVSGRATLNAGTIKPVASIKSTLNRSAPASGPSNIAPTDSELHHPSPDHVHEDLISFVQPTSPQDPPPSPASSSTTTASPCSLVSVHSSANSSPSPTSTSLHHLNTSSAVEPRQLRNALTVNKSGSKVFVPAGEDPAKHIAAATAAGSRKRGTDSMLSIASVTPTGPSRKKHSPSPPTSPILSREQHVEHQRGQQAVSGAVRQVSISSSNGNFQPQSLLASRHAIRTVDFYRPSRTASDTRRGNERMYSENRKVAASITSTAVPASPSTATAPSSSPATAPTAAPSGPSVATSANATPIALGSGDRTPRVTRARVARGYPVRGTRAPLPLASRRGLI